MKRLISLLSIVMLVGGQLLPLTGTANRFTPQVQAQPPIFAL